MRKKALFALVALLCCWAVDATASTLTENDALQIVKNSRIVEGLSNTDVNFYIAEVDTIINNYRCPVDVNTITEAWVTDNTPKWLVFVDEEPFKHWNHNCSYYYLQKNNLENSVMFEGCLPPRGINMQAIELHACLNYDNILNSIPQFRNTSYRIQSDVITNANETQVILYACSESFNTTIRYYSDIVTLYNCLRYYNIPKDNIHIVFEVNESTDFGVFQLLSKDIDNDDVDEINSNINLDDVVNELSNIKHPEHLIVFSATVGHAVTTGFSPHNQYYRETVFGPDVIDQIKPRFLTFLSCRHGAVLECDEIRDENLVFFGSCGIGETPSNSSTDLLVQGWVSAMMGYNIITNEPINTPNYNGYVSMSDAASIINDRFYSQISPNESEREIHFYSNPSDLCDNIGLLHIPDYSDLYIRDNNEDTGIEPNTTISNEITWNSPDIWIRNQDDGETNQYDDCLTIRNGNSTKYIYIRVNNKGGRAYTSGDQNLYITWAPLNLLQNPIEYFDAYTPITIPLNMTINADTCVIIKYPIQLSGDLITQINSNGGIASIGVSALVTNKQWYWGNYPEAHGTFTEYNDLALKKCTLMKPTDASFGNIPDGSLIETLYQEAVIPINIECTPTYLEIIPNISNATTNFPSSCVLSLSMSDELYNQWVQNGGQSTGFTSVTDNYFRLPINNCQISGLNSNGTIFIKSRINSVTNIPFDIVASFNVIAKDENGNMIDGASFIIKLNGNSNIGGPGDFDITQPGIDIGFNNGQIQLCARNVTEPSEYNWYDEKAKNVGNNKTIQILREQNNNFYLLSVRSLETNKVGFAAIDLNKINFIQSVSVSDNSINVKLFKKGNNNTIIRITSLQNEASRYFVVPKDDNEISISDLSNGIHVISVIINGKVVNNKQIII